MKKRTRTKLLPQVRRRRIIKAGEHARAAFDAACQCPAVSHWVGRERGEPFDQTRSQVLEYLLGHPDIRLWAFRCFYRSGAIVYDAAARKWRGREVSL